jgi:hypothetical protein
MIIVIYHDARSKIQSPVDDKLFGWNAIDIIFYLLFYRIVLSNLYAKLLDIISGWLLLLIKFSLVFRDGHE